MQTKELDSFKLSDAITFHDELNPKLWAGNKLRPEVKMQLQEIAKDFLEEMGIHDLDVIDITVSGSNAAYSYTKHSDLDLHILVNLKDLPNNEVYKELFQAKKTLYNDSHNITIHGVPVELYVQDANEPVVSLGEYSIKNDKWIKIPTKRRANFDQTASRLKYNKLLDIIKLALKSKNLAKVNKILKKIKQYRQAGLDKGGEFGPENLAYKALRSQGYITKLYALRDMLHSEELTIETMYQNIDEAKVPSVRDQIIADVQRYGGNIDEYFVRFTDSEKLGFSGKQWFGQTPDVDHPKFSVDYIGHGEGRRALWFYPLSYYLDEKNNPYASEQPYVWLVKLKPSSWMQTVKRGDNKVEPAPNGKVRVGIIRMSRPPAAIFFTHGYDVVGRYYDYAKKHKRHGKVKGRPEPSFFDKIRGVGEDYDPNGAPPGPEFKPTMPKGTVKVDVSDVYDWYKLGQHISNMKGLGKHDFGAGPPSTILSFGDEDTEHKYIKDLEKTGLATTDIDPVDPKQPKGMKRQKVDPTYNVSEARSSGYKEIEFVCVNPQFPDATDPKLQQQMYAGLQKIPGVIPLWQDQSDYSEGQSSLTAIYKDRVVRKEILKLAKQLGVTVDLEQPVSDSYVDRAIRGEHEGQRSITEIDNQSSAKTGIYQSEVYGTKAYHSKCLEKGCDWESRRYDRIKQAQDAAKKHAQTHIKSGVTEDETLQFASEKTPAINPYGGLKDKQYRGAIAETFDNPYPIKWEKSEFGDYDALATLPDGNPLTIMFNHESPDEVVITFWRNNNLDLTGEGDAQRVFATVLQAIQEFLKIERPATISFSASKEVEPGQNMMSRSKLYDRLVKRYAQQWGYDAQSIDHEEGVVYNLHRKQNVSEASGPQFVYHITPTKNLKSIAKQGLKPTVGDRSSQIAGEKSGIYVFPDKISAEDAVMNWLGDEFEDEPLTMLKIDVSGLQDHISKGADYELIVGTTIEPTRIKKLNVQLEEASGYIPSEKEKNDPRFKTALTVDVKPDSIKKNAKSFYWKTSRAGIPPTARADGKF